MIRNILLSATIASLGASALAAGFEPPVKPREVSIERRVLETVSPTVFNGPYLGVDLGGDLKRQKGHYTSTVNTAAGETLTNSGDVKGKRRWIGGLHGGYSAVFDRFYLAAEIFANSTFEKSARSTKTTTTSNNSSLVTRASTEIKNSYGLDIRPGFMLTPDSVLYLIGGVQRTKAEMKLHTNFADAITPDSGSQGLKKTRNTTGYRYGVGFQQRLASNLSGRIEYTGVKFKGGRKNLNLTGNTTTAAGSALTSNARFKLKQDLLMIGLSYHFS